MAWRIIMRIGWRSYALLEMLRVSWPGFVAISILLFLGLIMPAGIMATIRNSLSYINLAIPWAIFYSLGYPSFATAAFYGIGAYVLTYTLLSGLSPIVGVIASVLASFAIALALGAITLRLAGLFFFFATLAILEAIGQLLRYTEITLTGHIGKIVPIIVSDQLSLLILAALAVVNIAIYSYIMSTRHRIYIHTIRSDKVLATSVGVNPYRYSSILFGVTSAMQAASGSISAMYLLYIDPGSVFSPTISLLTLIIGLLGGYANILGPIVSSIAIVFLYEYTSRIAPYVNLVILGAIVMAFTLYLRTSLSDIIERLWPSRRSIIHYGRESR
jgi:branched-chain amino acid transport system permease protein